MKDFPAPVARISRLSLAAAALGALTLTACGGGGSSDSSTSIQGAFKYASVVVGQTSFSGYQPNQGGAVGATTLAQPTGAVATDGTELFIPDQNNSRVLGFSSIPAANGAAASFVVGQDSFTSGGPQTTAATTLALPGKAFVSSDGKLVVADPGNNRVLIWNSLPAGNQPADVVVGQVNYTSKDTGTSATQLSDPEAAVIANGKLIVADTGNNRVLVWNTVPTASGAAADVVIGQPDFTSNDQNNTCTPTSASPCTSSQIAGQNNLYYPQDVWSDGFRLLVADSNNNRVMFWKQIPSSNMTDATYVMGQSSFTRTSYGVSASTFHAPYGVASDSVHIYIADTGNNRVLVFNSFPTSNGGSADSVLGQDSFTRNTANDDDQNNHPDDNPTGRTLSGPTGVAIASSMLYVTDTGNNRVLLFKQ